MPAIKQTAEIGRGKRGPGRPKGSVNKVTADVKAAILAAFNKVGGEKYLATQAKDNPQAFMTLLGKVLPTEIKAEIKAVVTRIELVAPDGNSAG